MDEDFMEFNDDSQQVEEYVQAKEESSIPTVSLYAKTYTEETDYYTMFRQKKLDPITHQPINMEYAFAYPYMWNYEGEIIGEDPYGPIYFNCDNDSIIKCLFYKRLFKLYNYEYNDVDIGIACGEDFYISGRGKNQNWYAFRLPICDCYLEENIKFIPMIPPKLTDKDIEEIHQKHRKWAMANNVRTNFSLLEMKKQYDNAIALCVCDGMCQCMAQKKQSIMALTRMHL